MKIVRIILFSLVALFLSGCAIKDYVPKNEAVLTNNYIEFEPEKYNISRSDIQNNIVQKPNRSFMGWMPRVWLYYKTIDKTDKGFYRWVNKNIAIEPVYVNDKNMAESKRLIEKYLNNTGYFKSKVTPEKTIVEGRALVDYVVHPSKPYYIRNIDYKIGDSAIAREIKKIQDELPVKEGEIYNAYTMDKQRDLITTHLRDNGYFMFTRDYIIYEVDTNLMQNKADVTMRIDGKKHDKYEIEEVFIYPDFKMSDTGPYDTVTRTFSLSKRGPEYDFNFIYSKNPKMHLKTFDQVIQTRPGELFSQKKISQTYRALGSLKIYSISNINIDTIPGSNDSVKPLKCDIILQKGKLNYYNIQLEGNNSGGDLGALGSISYRNNNIFRGSEVLRITLRGGFQAQRVEDYIISEGLFNTKELGIDVSILFPRFLSPIKLNRFVIEYQPKTILSTGYNMQVRPLYTRYIGMASFGYNWKTTPTIEHILTPINFNIVKVLPDDLFAFLLEFETNQRIKEQYTDHMIFGLNYSFIFNNQNIKKKDNDFFYLKFDIETSGNLLSLFNNTSLITENDGHHEIMGIRYSQFFKYQFDFRFYHYFTSKNTLAMRFVYGQGVAYGNSTGLPFERSFYAGGTNGMRGWRFRSLGPGEFKNEYNYDIEHIGDLQLETNFEYRFPLYSVLKGALFCDMGNIWTLSNDEAFPGGQFKFDKFYKQIAVDAGLGLRFDFSFFLIRLDIAAPLCDPAYDEGQRWRISKLQWRDLVWNFGIGYPF